MIAVLTAILLASHQLSSDTNFGLIGNYIYWICRIGSEAGIFMAVLFGVERYLGTVIGLLPKILISIMISLVPFALAVTAFDLIIGLPEIGFNEDSASNMSTPVAFAYELIYLSDNHAALCALLMLPRFLSGSLSSFNTESDNVALESNETNGTKSAQENGFEFIAALDPPLKGNLYSVEAQEHYVQVTSSEESRMVLYRFSDVVRQLPESLGMQVHRSHWVAFSAVERSEFQGQAMKLVLKSGNAIPVSRTFRAAVESKFS